MTLLSPYFSSYHLGQAATSTWNVISPVIPLTLCQNPHGWGSPGLLPLPPLLASSTLIPNEGWGIKGRVGSPGRWEEVERMPGHPGGLFLFASAPPAPPGGSVGAQTPATSPSFPLQKQLLPSGTPEVEAELAQDWIWSSWVPWPNEQINVVLMAVYFNSQHLSSNTTISWKLSHLYVWTTYIFYLTCKSFSICLLQPCTPIWTLYKVLIKYLLILTETYTEIRESTHCMCTITTARVIEIIYQQHFIFGKVVFNNKFPLKSYFRRKTFSHEPERFHNTFENFQTFYLFFLGAYL